MNVHTYGSTSNPIYDKLVNIRPAVAEHVRLYDLSVVRNSSNSFKLQALVRNSKSKPYTLRYRVYWYNANGKRMPSNSDEWQALRVPPNTSQPLSSNSPAGAATFRLYLNTAN